MVYKTFKIYNLGCKVNQYDGGKIASLLLDSGLKNVSYDADLAIVNTCAVTKNAIIKDNKVFKKAQKENPDAKLVVTGCLSRVYKDKIKGKVDLVVTVAETEKQIAEIFRLIKFKANKASDIKTIKSLVSLNQNRSRYFIKIQDGCEQFCSYCIIPYTRGKLKSRQESDIIKEISGAIADGYQEIILSGIHLGLYGVDLKTNLLALIKKIIVLPGFGRLRLSSIEVREVTDDLIDLIHSSNGKICPHLHIPLQSGSDKILKLMNRPYDSKFFVEKIKTIRKKIPDCAINTDVIVGFPGESERDFKSSVDVIKKCRLSRLHIFPFSAHDIVPASKMGNQIPEDIVKWRANFLRILNHKLTRQYRKKFKDKEVSVLVEDKNFENYRGKTEYYFNVTFTSKDILYNKSEEIKLKRIIKIKI